MPEPGELPPSTSPVPPPSSNEEALVLRAALAALQTELDQSKRSYTGLDGNFKAVKTERDALVAQIAEATKISNASELALNTELITLKTTAEEATTKLTQLESSSTTTAEQLAAFQTLVTDYPDLVPAFSKKLIRIDGLKGDELKAYLDTWKSNIEEVNLGDIAKKNSGTSLPPPNQDIASVSLDVATDNKLTALRTKGAGSEEYKKWSIVEADLIKNRQKK